MNTVAYTNRIFQKSMGTMATEAIINEFKSI